MSVEEHLVARLAAAVAGTKRSFTCAGSFLPKKPVTLTFPKSKEKVVFGAKPMIVPLLDRAVQAAFGKGERTLHDRNIRDALQLKAPAFSVENFDPRESGVLDEANRVLCPDAPGSLEAKLYDVNVYERGGLFVGHKDTPAERDMLGTLVVCLPLRFRGGELVLRHAGEELTYDFATAIEQQKEPQRVHWAAFFGDVDHAVRQVRAGARVTLTYRLLVKPKAAAAARGTAPFLDRLKGELRNAVNDARFLPGGGTLAFPCFHLYGYKTFPEPGSLDAESVLRLKGRDRFVAIAARELKLKVELRPYLVEREEPTFWTLERFPTEADVRGAPKRRPYPEGGEMIGVTGDDLDEAFGLGDPDDEEAVWVIDRPWMGKTKYRVERDEDFDEDAAQAEDEEEEEPELDEDDEDEDEDEEADEDDEDEDEDEEDDDDEAEAAAPPPPADESLGPDRPALGHLFTADYSPTGYFGNEGGEGNFYLFAALRVAIPEAAKRGLARTPDALKAAMLRVRQKKK